MSKCCDKHGRCKLCRTMTEVKTFYVTNPRTGQTKTKMGRVCPNPSCANHR